MNTGWSGKWSGEIRRILFLILIVPAAYGQTRVPEQPSNPSGPPTATARAIIDQYCVPCHNQRLKTAGLMLDKLDSTEVRTRTIPRLAARVGVSFCNRSLDESAIPACLGGDGRGNSR